MNLYYPRVRIVVTYDGLGHRWESPGASPAVGT